MAWIAVWIILLLLLYLFYRWSTKTYRTFEERGIPHEKPIPLFGNGFPFMRNYSLHKLMLHLHHKNKKNKIYGFYNFRSPFFIINDPDLVKKLGVKDFDTFPNHQRVFNQDADPVFRGMLSVMQDQRWRDMRNTVSPLYTAAKMRAMFTLMNECFEEAIQYLHSNLDPKTNSIELEMKDYFCRLSNDLIATTAFGVKVNSFEDRDNEFYSIGMTISKSRELQALKFILFSIAPQFFKWLGLKVFDEEKANYFTRIVVDTMRYREEHKIERPDMIHLLMEARKESEHQWTDEDIVGQCFLFFFASFENNAITLSTICYELAENPDIQEKLYEEVMKTDKELHGKVLDYDTLKDMELLDMVVAEALRKWTLAAMVDRECIKDYTVYDDEGNFICELKKGDRIWFQIVGFHWDEEYFEKPEIFNPERFSKANKEKIKPLSYSPFGIGPRFCVGNRYGLMQAKAAIYYLIRDFRVERSPKLCKDLMEDLVGFTIAPKSGFWFNLVKRNQTKSI